MFSSFKTFFNFNTADIQPATSKETSVFARISENNELFSPNGELIGTYSRRRDAVRGASRRGFKLAA